MVQYIGEAEHLLLIVTALVRHGVVPEVVIESRQRHSRKVRCGSWMRTSRTVPMRHFDESTHQCRARIVRAESTVQNISLLLPSELFLLLDGYRAPKASAANNVNHDVNVIT